MTKAAVYQVCPMSRMIAKQMGIGSQAKTPMFAGNATIIALDENTTRILVTILEQASENFETAEQLVNLLHGRRIASKLNQEI